MNKDQTEVVILVKGTRVMQYQIFATEAQVTRLKNGIHDVVEKIRGEYVDEH